MNKLVELLNEYHHFNSDLIYYWWDEEYKRVYFHTEFSDEWIDEQRVDNEWICSKRFWFIKWLVDNDKIRKSYKEWLPAITKNWFLLEWDTVLLMLLSISDTPIDDLISYLR